MPPEVQTPLPSSQPPVTKKPFPKKPLLIILGIVLVLCVAGGVSAFVLSHVTKQGTQVTKTPAELAKQANDDATASANKGDTAGALTHYQEALTQYQKAGDKAGEAGVKLQIQYYQKVKADEDKAKAAAAATPTSETP